LKFQRIISIDIMDGRVVRLERGRPDKPIYYGLTPREYAILFSNSGCDRLHIVDLDAALGRGDNRRVIGEIISVSRKPTQVAGGIRNLKRAEEILGLGAWKIVVSSVIFTDLDEVSRMLEMFGPERLIAALDVREDGHITIHGWRREIDLDLANAITYVMKLGFREIIITDTSRDGTLTGVSETTLGRIPSDVRERVIVAGGVSGEDDIRLVMEMGFGGVVLGKAVYEGRIKLW
jgi:phosphoribosylformimino-5-aminoimidazole carboxamide ribotide isomerase